MGAGARDCSLPLSLPCSKAAALVERRPPQGSGCCAARLSHHARLQEAAAASILVPWKLLLAQPAKGFLLRSTLTARGNNCAPVLLLAIAALQTVVQATCRL